MVVPSTNTAAEPIACALAHTIDADVSVHFSRLAGSSAAAPTGTEPPAADRILHAASLLVDARVQAICVYGAWLHARAERDMCRRLEADVHVPVTASSVAILDGLRDLGVERYGLALSCSRARGERVVEALRHGDFECVRVLWGSESANKGRWVGALLDAATRPHAQAIVAVTEAPDDVRHMRTLEARSGIPVMDSVVATVSRGMRRAGVQALTIGPQP